MPRDDSPTWKVHMYERFYDLKEKPFNLTPDPEFLYMADQHKLALEQVLYGIRRREGFTMLVGDVGTGKTTLCWALLGQLERNVRSALVLNPMLSEEDMLRAIIQDFGVEPKVDGKRARPEKADGSYDPSWMDGRSRKALVDELNAFLLEGADKEEFCVAIIDEAQDLSVGVLEQLRLLSNLETAKKKLLQIIFVGQLEFERKLKDPQLRSLDQRISIRHRIQPLSRPEVQSYIEHRLKVAGASPRLVFTDAAYRAVYKYSEGYPRLVNLICDRTLLAGSSERQFHIGARLVRKAAKTLRGNWRPGNLFPSLRWAVLSASAVLLLAVVAEFLVFFARGTWHFGPDRTTTPASPVAAVSASGSVAQPAPQPEPQVPPEVHATPPAPPTQNEERVPTAQPVAPPAASGISEGSQREFFVQVHSLASAADAIEAMKSLQENGFTSSTKQVGGWHVVYVGPFDSYAAAEQCQRDLQERSTRPLLVRRASN